MRDHAWVKIPGTNVQKLGLRHQHLMDQNRANTAKPNGHKRLMNQANAETKTEKQILIQPVYQSAMDDLTSLKYLVTLGQTSTQTRFKQKPVSNNTTQSDPAHNNSKIDHFQLYSC